MPLVAKGTSKSNPKQKDSRASATMAAAIEKGENPKEEKNKEGYNLLGSPTLEKLDNGRYKCLETGHEMLPKDKDSYINSKRCRLGLIDAALSQKKVPLNMFKQDPHCKLKLVCKLTGDIVNKTEEHIWKHINGKRFLNKLEQKESNTKAPNKMAVEKVEEKSDKVSKLTANGGKKDKKNKKKKDKILVVDKDAMRDKQSSDAGSDLDEPDFWAPVEGSYDEDKMGADEENGIESAELTVRTKRMSIEVGPSSFASRKKKKKTSIE